MFKLKYNRLLLAVSGGIACYKSIYLARNLIKLGINVQVVMTPNAVKFITPLTFQAITNNLVFVEEWDNRVNNNMAHINLTRNIDGIILAPATANTMAKIAYGMADNLLLSLILASPKNVPIWLAPSMNVEMWNKNSTQKNIQSLIEQNYKLIMPNSGEQACGENGLGRMEEPDNIIDKIICDLTPKKLAGKNILITAGATREFIDPVRYITNASSGKMGYALAKIARNLGANVTLISGINDLDIPKNINYIQVQTAQDMYNEVLKFYANKQIIVNKKDDIFISVAAVSDWTIVEPSLHKIKKQVDINTNNIQLTKTLDILKTVANLDNPPFCIGFAAETQNLIEYAKDKLIKKNLDLIVANLMSDGFGGNTNKAWIISKESIEELPTMDKEELAGEILYYLK